MKPVKILGWLYRISETSFSDLQYNIELFDYRIKIAIISLRSAVHTYSKTVEGSHNTKYES